MIKQIAWNTFKNTGNINTMMELIKVEETINRTAEENASNGSIKNKRNSFSSTQYE